MWISCVGGVFNDSRPKNTEKQDILRCVEIMNESEKSAYESSWLTLSDSDEAKWGYNEAIVWLGLVIVSIIVFGLKPARLGGLVLHGDCYINRRI